MKMVIRGVILLWGVAITLVAVGGIFDPSAFTQRFGVTAQGSAVNALRADFGAFFLVAGLAALWGALRPVQTKVLWVPAALFGAAFCNRIIGLALGDPYSPSIGEAMAIEAVSVLLMMGGAFYLGRK